jgi:hypothetical protein
MLMPSTPRLAAVFAAPIGIVQLVLTLFLPWGNWSTARFPRVSGGARY